MADKLQQQIAQGANLKAVDNSQKKDASAPQIDPHLKTNAAAGKQTRAQLSSEIQKEHRLKPVKTRDASEPFVPVPINNPDSAKVQALIKELWSKDNRRAWLLMGYSGPETVVYEGHGTGAISEAVAKLQDNKIQYLLVRLPLTKKEGEITVDTVRDVFVAWTGPRVPIIEKGRKKIHIGSMAAFLKPSHAELQAVNRDLLTEQNLLYCSDPHGAHIIDYAAVADPKAVTALQQAIKGTDWRQDLKHVEPHKDASAPAVDPHLKVNVVAGKETKTGVLAEVKDTDWREDLKHVEPHKDASAPAIDPHLKVNVNAGKQRKENLKKELGTGIKLRPAPVVRDASAPEVPEPINCPDTAKVHDLIKTLFATNSTRGWILLGYKDKTTIALEASGTGNVSEIVPRLGDDKIQYFLVRIPISEKAGEIAVNGVRDVMVVWTGPHVPVIEKAKKKIHFGGVSHLLKPHHANLTAIQKDLLTEQNLLYCSEPGAGAHIIEYEPQQDPRLRTNLKTDIVKTDWRQDLKHVEPHKDASAPLIEKKQG